MPITRQQFDRFIEEQKYPPNKFQQQVLEAIAFGEGSIAVNALAGSGKTTLLVQCAALLKLMGVPPSDVMFLAFNKSIRDELNNRLSGGYKAINSHSYGNGLLRDVIGKKMRVDFKKFRTLIEEHVLDPVMPIAEFTRGERYIGSRQMESIISKAMNNMVEPDDHLGIMSVAEHHGLMDSETLAEDVIMAMIRCIPQVMQAAEAQARNTGEISFDEMLYLPVRFKSVTQTFKWVLVDEAQDLNRAQQELLRASTTKDTRVVIVGDKNQAIYGFAGADHVSFSRMINVFEAKELPLNICYRCDEAIIKYAQQVVPQIEARPGAPAGKVEANIDIDHLHKRVQPGDMIICRLNAPLLGAYFKLISQRIPAQIVGRDVASQLTSLIEKIEKHQRYRSFEDFVPALREYARQQQIKFSKDEYGETKAQMLDDTVECLITCYDNFEVTGMPQFKSELEALFPASETEDKQRDKQRDKYVSLSSVHRAKGLEADRVVILAPDRMPFKHPKQQAWELEQEFNIMYVAMTRAKHEMLFVGPAPVKVLGDKEAAEERAEDWRDKDTEVATPADTAAQCRQLAAVAPTVPDIEARPLPDAPTPAPHDVTEHLRKLPPGKRPTPRAYELAREYDIDLRNHPGHTFVSPHTRESDMSEPDRPEQPALLADLRHETKTLLDDVVGADADPIQAALMALDVQQIDAMIHLLTLLKTAKASAFPDAKSA